MPSASSASAVAARRSSAASQGRVDILTGTLGKALGGASGGYTAGRAEIIELLRQRSRPYLFSNSLAPCIAAASLEVLKLLGERRGRDVAPSRAGERRTLPPRDDGAGFRPRAGQHPIIPVMLGDAALATRMAEALLAEGIYVIGFSYPVVPKGKARIRTQMSAAHTDAADRHRRWRAFGKGRPRSSARSGDRNANEAERQR